MFKSLSSSAKRALGHGFQPCSDCFIYESSGVEEDLSLWHEHSVLKNEVNLFTGQDRKLRKPLQIITDKTQIINTAFQLQNPRIS